MSSGNSGNLAGALAITTVELAREFQIFDQLPAPLRYFLNSCNMNYTALDIARYYYAGQLGNPWEVDQRDSWRTAQRPELYGPKYPLLPIVPLSNAKRKRPF